MLVEPSTTSAVARVGSVGRRPYFVGLDGKSLFFALPSSHRLLTSRAVRRVMEIVIEL